MKLPLFIVSLFVALFPAWAADSIKFNEILHEVDICYREEGETYCEVSEKNSGRFSARVTIPGLSALTFNEDTEIRIAIGLLELFCPFNEAAIFGRNRAVFHMLESYEIETEEDIIIRYRRIGALTLSRAGDTLTVNASFRRLPSPIASNTGLWNEDGAGQLAFRVTLDGDQISERNVYFKGLLTKRPSRDPNNSPLRHITVKGQADFTRPTVTITSPHHRATATNDTITFRGTAKDNYGVAEVQYRVSEDDWSSCELISGPTLQWTAEVPVAPGTNVVQVRSLDYEGLESKPVTRTVLRPLPQ